MFRRRVRQGTTPLSLYLHHQHSKLFFNAVFPLKAEDRTWQGSEPLVMEPSTPDVQTSLAQFIAVCRRVKLDA